VFDEEIVGDRLSQPDFPKVVVRSRKLGLWQRSCLPSESRRGEKEAKAGKINHSRRKKGAAAGPPQIVRVKSQLLNRVEPDLGQFQAVVVILPDKIGESVGEK